MAHYNFFTYPPPDNATHNIALYIPKYNIFGINWNTSFDSADVFVYQRLGPGNWTSTAVFSMSPT
jgi:hypothetical protein